MGHTKQHSLQYLEIRETLLPPLSTLQVSAQMLRPPGIRIPLTWVHFSPQHLLTPETLVYYLSPNIRLYTPDLRCPIT